MMSDGDLGRLTTHCRFSKATWVATLRHDSTMPPLRDEQSRVVGHIRYLTRHLRSNLVSDAWELYGPAIAKTWKSFFHSSNIVVQFTPVLISSNFDLLSRLCGGFFRNAGTIAVPTSLLHCTESFLMSAGRKTQTSLLLRTYQLIEIHSYPHDPSHKQTIIYESLILFSRNIVVAIQQESSYSGFLPLSPRYLTVALLNEAEISGGSKLITFPWHELHDRRGRHAEAVRAWFPALLQRN